MLVELDSEQVRADLAAAEAALAESRSQYKRSRELYATKILSDSQLEQIEATFKANEARVASARARVNDTVIRAPFAGRVGRRRVSVGSLISPGTVITTLDDTSTVKLDFTVPETFLSVVRPGREITARSVAYPDASFAGKVSSIDSRVDPATRSVTVRALLPNPQGLLKPGMFLTTRLSRGAIDALLVPEQALVPEGGEMFASGSTVEKYYAEYANQLKQLANDARKFAVNIKGIKYSPSANKTYSSEVESLKAKLSIANRNRPLERQAQLVANKLFKSKQDAFPDMSKDKEKKLKGKALIEARVKLGAKKHQIEVTQKEWNAIQAGAISNNLLSRILMNTDLDLIRTYSLPRTKYKMTDVKVSRAKSMHNSGYTLSEIANALGVSSTTIEDLFK